MDEVVVWSKVNRTPRILVGLVPAKSAIGTRTVWNMTLGSNEPTGRETTATDFSVTDADCLSWLFAREIEKSTSPEGSPCVLQRVPKQRSATRNSSAG